jgi:ferredoxin
MVCLYEAIEYEHGRIKLEIDMTKCTYPKCTLCIDGCPQDSLDFSKSPPFVHNWCEGCNLCWAICPEDAVIIANIKTAEAFFGARKGEPGGAAQAPMAMGLRTPPKYRPLIRQEDVGTKGPARSFTFVPRFVQNKEDWPYEMEE